MEMRIDTIVNLDSIRINFDEKETFQQFSCCIDASLFPGKFIRPYSEFKMNFHFFIPEEVFRPVFDYLSNCVRQTIEESQKCD